jgi:hypothetical protein
VDGTTSDGFLVGALAWLVGVAVAVVFGLLAYLYYEVSVVLAMAAVGFVLGASLMVGLNVRWSWVVLLVGVLVGLALAVLSVVGQLPMMLLTVLTALGGAGTVVAGIMRPMPTADPFTAPMTGLVQR